jgi:hypothetical protein
MLNDDIIRKNVRKNENIKKEKEIRERNLVNDDEEEETFMYDIRKPMAFINEGDNGVFDINRQTGINTAKSVFEKGTLFVTGRR